MSERTLPPLGIVFAFDSHRLWVGSSLRAGLPNCLLFGMAGFSADSCNWHIALLRHVAGIELFYTGKDFLSIRRKDHR